MLMTMTDDEILVIQQEMQHALDRISGIIERERRAPSDPGVQKGEGATPPKPGRAVRSGLSTLFQDPCLSAMLVEADRDVYSRVGQRLYEKLTEYVATSRALFGHDVGDFLIRGLEEIANGKSPKVGVTKESPEKALEDRE